MAENYFTGVVVRATGSWYEVLSGGERLQCRIRGKLRLKGVRSTNPVVVGDEVSCLTDEQGSHVIIDITPRRNYVIRRASNLSKESHIIAANIDQALLLVTLRQPETAWEFVDRFLVTCEAYKIPVVILLAKSDLQEKAEVDFFRATYEPIGYRVVEVSAVTARAWRRCTTSWWGARRSFRAIRESANRPSCSALIPRSTSARAISPRATTRGAIRPPSRPCTPSRRVVR